MPIDAELLPCPFCGGKSVLTNVRQSDHTFYVGCYADQCVRPRTDACDSKDWVIKLWNDRSGASYQAAPPSAWQPKVDGPDTVCEHGTAADVHCCNCHSGFIFDLQHECEEPMPQDPGNQSSVPIAVKVIRQEPTP